jgi:hypothetical protein
MAIADFTSPAQPPWSTTLVLALRPIHHGDNGGGSITSFGPQASPSTNDGNNTAISYFIAVLGLSFDD